MSSNSRPRRSTRKDPWDEDELMTSDKSKLIGLDLVKIFAKPEAWNCLEEEEKKQILNLLPEHIHPNPEPTADGSEAKIPPLPQDFLRYCNNWRGGVRQFQVDLECGRYDPEWLRQADDAMKERAAGRFDNWKEKEFEQFWGQKQKLGADAMTGEAAQVKMETLVEHGVVHIGDVWRYERSLLLEKGDRSNLDRLLIEKEVKIVDIVGTSLTFAIPAGQRVVFPHHVEIPEEKLATARATPKPAPARRSASSAKTNSNAKTSSTESQLKRGTRSSKRRSSARQAGPRKRKLRGGAQEQEDESPENIMSDTNDQELPRDAENVKNSAEDSNEHPPDSHLDSVPVNGHAEPVDLTEDPTLTVDTSIPSNHKEDANQFTVTTKTEGHEQNNAAQAVKSNEVTEEQQPKQEASETTPKPTEEKPSESQPPTAHATIDDLIILPHMTRPSELEHNILAIDGRRKGLRNINSWKQFRCYRNNQDIGNLWELRQSWYLKHYT